MRKKKKFKMQEKEKNVILNTQTKNSKWSEKVYLIFWLESWKQKRARKQGKSNI